MAHDTEASPGWSPPSLAQLTSWVVTCWAKPTGAIPYVQITSNVTMMWTKVSQ